MRFIGVLANKTPNTIAEYVDFETHLMKVRKVSLIYF